MLLSVALAGALLLLAACEGDEGTPPEPAASAGPATTQVATLGETSTPTAIPVPVATPRADWPVPNGDPANTRYRASDLDAETVEFLTTAWEFPLTGGGPYGLATGEPVIADGVAYVQTLGGVVSAIELETGNLEWQAYLGVPTAGPVGPAVEAGRVFIAAGGGEVVALDAETGSQIWSAEIEKDGFQPTVVDDLVIVGTGAQAHIAGNSGFVHAFDVATGAPRWSFQVVEDGFWGAPELNSGGGIWYPPAVDRERGLIYVGTGNAGPYPGTVQYPNGTSRPGPNLYSSSLVALDIETGAIEWYHQVVPHGLFDHDFQASPILATATIDGEERELLLGAGKVGRVVALDPDTREVVWDAPVGRHENDDLEEIPLGEAVLVFPGIYGGVETPMAVAEDMVYVPIVNLGTLHTATGHGAGDGSSALINAANATNFAAGTGELVALDLATGEQLWQVEFPSPVFGGATVLGDVVFTATFDGVITGLDRHTGEQVWQYHAGGAINAWPAVQDGWIIWPIGLGPYPRLITFRVEEPVPLTATPAAPLATP